jgi:exodeoxyribonuclease VII small subunit
VGSGWLTVRVPTKPSPGTPQPAPDHPQPDDLTGLSYEQARDELVGVVARLEAGGASLEESLVLWERGEALAARCQEWLDGARVRLESARADVSPGVTGPGTNGPDADDSTGDDPGSDDAMQQDGAR